MRNFNVGSDGTVTNWRQMYKEKLWILQKWRTNNYQRKLYRAEELINSNLQKLCNNLFLINSYDN